MHLAGCFPRGWERFSTVTDTRILETQAQNGAQGRHPSHSRGSRPGRGGSPEGRRHSSPGRTQA